MFQALVIEETDDILLITQQLYPTQVMLPLVVGINQTQMMMVALNVRQEPLLYFNQQQSVLYQQQTVTVEEEIYHKSVMLLLIDWEK